MATRSEGGPRRRPRRQEVRRILVVAEGTKTEPQYVERLNAFLRSKKASATVKTVGVGRDPVKVVQACMHHRVTAARLNRAYDDWVCLVDFDQHDTLLEAMKLARREQITVLVSRLKFEVWLLWHLEQTRSALTSSQLDSRMKTLNLLRGKSLASTFPIERYSHAVIVARDADPDLKPGRVGPDPSSALPVLVDLLLSR